MQITKMILVHWGKWFTVAVRQWMPIISEIGLSCFYIWWLLESKEDYALSYCLVLLSVISTKRWGPWGLAGVGGVEAKPNRTNRLLLGQLQRILGWPVAESLNCFFEQVQKNKNTFGVFGAFLFLPLCRIHLIHWLRYWKSKKQKDKLQKINALHSLINMPFVTYQKSWEIQVAQCHNFPCCPLIQKRTLTEHTV